MIVKLQGHADHIIAFFASIAATTELSTPPDMATTTRVSAGDLATPELSGSSFCIFKVAFNYCENYRKILWIIFDVVHYAFNNSDAIFVLNEQRVQMPELTHKGKTFVN